MGLVAVQCGQFLKSLWNLLQCCFCFMFCFGLVFWLQGVWDLRSPTIKPVPNTWGAQSLNHWTTREVSDQELLESNLDENPSSFPCSLMAKPFNLSRSRFPIFKM